MSKIKVVSRLPGWFRVVALVALAVVVEGGYLALDDARGTNESIHQLLNWALLATFLLLPTVLSLTEQRLGRAVLESFLMGATAAVTCAISVDVANGKPEPVNDYLMGVAGGGAAFAAVRLIAVLIVRNFVRKVTLQTGCLCWRCAYDLTGNTSGTCPECGVKT